MIIRTGCIIYGLRVDGCFQVRITVIFINLLIYNLRTSLRAHVGNRTTSFYIRFAL
jgi:hypothetical protein